MADIAHSTLTGSDLHEPKGVASATSGQIYIADGAGSGVWTAGSTLNPFSNQLLHIQEKYATGTTGQALSGGMNTKVLNYVKTNQISGASLSTNIITLPAGTYYCDSNFIVRLNGAINGQGLLFNNTTSLAILQGQSFNVATGSSTINIQQSIKGVFTLAGTSAIALLQYISGLGPYSGFPGYSGYDEIYTDICIWKL